MSFTEGKKRPVLEEGIDGQHILILMTHNTVLYWNIQQNYSGLILKVDYKKHYEIETYQLQTREKSRKRWMRFVEEDLKMMGD